MAIKKIRIREKITGDKQSSWRIPKDKRRKCPKCDSSLITDGTKVWCSYNNCFYITLFSENKHLTTFDC